MVVLCTMLLVLTHCAAVLGEQDGLDQDSLSASGAFGIGHDEGMTTKEMLARIRLQSPVVPTAPSSPLPSSSSSSSSSLSLSTTSQAERANDEQHRTTSTGARLSPSSRPGPSPSEDTPDGLTAGERAFRIAMLRRQLMDKIGLTGLPPPSNQTFRSLPLAIKKRLLGRQQPQRDLPKYVQPASEITEVLSYAENYTNGCPDQGFCFRFRLVNNIIGKPIKSAHLWMFLTSSDEINRSPVRCFTVWLLLAGKSAIKRKELVTKVVSKREGWFHLELPQERIDWGILEYRIQLTNAARDSSQSPSRFPAVSLARDELPILTVAIDVDKHHRRQRRQTQCTAASETCCLHAFQVTLSEVLGGSVAQPTDIEANFCRGNCMQVASFATLHAKMMRDRALVETAGTDLRNDMLPCCVPASYNPPQSMMIWQSNGTLVLQQVSEISAESCSCK